MNSSKHPVPDWADMWTLDEVAECLDVSGELSGKLWSMLEKIPEGDRTPMGGDGTGGTVEYPDARWNPEDSDKLHHHWDSLSESEQKEIVDAYDREYGDRDGAEDD